jgi:hypothetical protein
MLCAGAGLEVRALAPVDGLPGGVLAGPPALVAPLFELVR